MDKYNCKICNKEIKILKNHLKNTHKMVIDDYFLKFEKSEYDSYMEKTKLYRQEMSPNSIFFYLKKGLSKDESLIKLKEHNLNNPFRRLDISPRQYKYWMNLGFSEEEAKEKISLLNSNSLESLTIIYGNEEGEKRYNKFINSLKDRKYIIINKISKDQKLSYEDAVKEYNLKMRNISPYVKEYWIKKGFSEEEALLKIIEVGKNCSPRLLNYWIKKTNSLDKAKKLHSEFQDNNSLISISNRLNCSITDAINIQNIFIKKMLSTLKEQGFIFKKDSNEFFKYKSSVISLTKKNFKLHKNIIDPKNLRGVDYHLDHKYSIFEGYLNNIDPDIIASIYNLEILNASDNCSKNIKCSITKEDLINNYKK